MLEGGSPVALPDQTRHGVLVRNDLFTEAQMSSVPDSVNVTSMEHHVIGIVGIQT